MKKKLFPVVLAISVMLILSMTFAGNVAAKKLIIFAGGPAGGTFQVVAQSIATYKPVKAMDYNIKVQSSGGSTENLRKVNSGKAHFGTVYSGHVYAGRNGLMVNDPTKYENVLAVAYLYEAPAQLVVRKGAGITSTVKCSSPIWGSGTKSNATPWATVPRPTPSATTSWMLSGCSPPTPTAP